MKYLIIVILFLSLMQLLSCGPLFNQCRDLCSPAIGLSFLDSLDNKDVFNSGRYDISKVYFTNEYGDSLRANTNRNLPRSKQGINYFVVHFDVATAGCDDLSKKIKFYIHFNSHEVDSIEFIDRIYYYENIQYNGIKTDFNEGDGCWGPLYILK